MEDLHLPHNGSKISLNLKGKVWEKMNMDAKEKWGWGGKAERKGKPKREPRG